MSLHGAKMVKNKYRKPPQNLRQLRAQAEELNVAYQALTQMPSLLSPTWRFDTLEKLRARFSQQTAFPSLEQVIETRLGLEALKLFLAVRTMAQEIYRIESNQP
jgi:hypothetical protein